MLELPAEWLSLAQLSSGHLPTSVIELARILVGGLQCTQAQVRLVPSTLGRVACIVSSAQLAASEVSSGQV